MNKLKLLPSLLVFSEVANQASFTRAAKVLGLSKSTVSQQISRLEDGIGMQLLLRNTRGISVTAIGQRLLQRCELLQDQVDLAFLELSIEEQTPTGTFSVTMPHGLEECVGIPALSQLCREFPGIQPTVHVSDEKNDLIKNKLDVAIYGGEPEDSNYRALPIGSMKEIICATPEYLQKHGEPQMLKELLTHRWIVGHWQKSPIAVYEDIPQAHSEHLTLNQFAKANTISCITEMALQHIGFVMLPDIVANRMIQTGKLVRILENYRGSLWPFYFIHPFQNEKPLHVTRFHQLLTHYFSKSVINN